MPSVSDIVAGRAVVTLELDGAAFARDLQHQEDAFQQSVKRMRKIGMAAMAAGGAGMYTLEHARKSAIEYDTSIRTATSEGLSPDERKDPQLYENVRKEVEALAKKIQKDTGDFHKLSMIAESLQDVTKALNLSLTNKDDQKLLETMVSSSLKIKSYDQSVQLDDMALLMSNYLTNYGEDSKNKAQDVSKFLAQVQEVAASTSGTVTDYKEALTYVMGTAKTSGLVQEEMLAALGALSNQGINGSMAGNTLKRIALWMQQSQRGDKTAKQIESSIAEKFATKDADALVDGVDKKDLNDAQLAMIEKGGETIKTLTQEAAIALAEGIRGINVSPYLTDAKGQEVKDAAGNLILDFQGYFERLNAQQKGMLAGLKNTHNLTDSQIKQIESLINYNRFGLYSASAASRLYENPELIGKHRKELETTGNDNIDVMYERAMKKAGGGNTEQAKQMRLEAAMENATIAIAQNSQQWSDFSLEMKALTSKITEKMAEIPGAMDASGFASLGLEVAGAAAVGSSFIPKGGSLDRGSLGGYGSAAAYGAAGAGGIGALYGGRQAIDEYMRLNKLTDLGESAKKAVEQYDALNLARKNVAESEANLNRILAKNGKNVEEQKRLTEQIAQNQERVNQAEAELARKQANAAALKDAHSRTLFAAEADNVKAIAELQKEAATLRSVDDLTAEIEAAKSQIAADRTTKRSLNGKLSSSVHFPNGNNSVEKAADVWQKSMDKLEVLEKSIKGLNAEVVEAAKVLQEPGRLAAELAKTEASIKEIHNQFEAVRNGNAKIGTADSEKLLSESKVLLDNQAKLTKSLEEATIKADRLAMTFSERLAEAFQQRMMKVFSALGAGGKIAGKAVGKAAFPVEIVMAALYIQQAELRGKAMGQQGLEMGLTMNQGDPKRSIEFLTELLDRARTTRDYKGIWSEVNLLDLIPSIAWKELITGKRFGGNDDQRRLAGMLSAAMIKSQEAEFAKQGKALDFDAEANKDVFIKIMAQYGEIIRLLQTNPNTTLFNSDLKASNMVSALKAGMQVPRDTPEGRAEQVAQELLLKALRERITNFDKIIPFFQDPLIPLPGKYIPTDERAKKDADAAAQNKRYTEKTIKNIQDRIKAEATGKKPSEQYEIQQKVLNEELKKHLKTIQQMDISAKDLTKVYDALRKANEELLQRQKEGKPLGNAVEKFGEAVKPFAVPTDKPVKTVPNDAEIQQKDAAIHILDSEDAGNRLLADLLSIDLSALDTNNAVVTATKEIESAVIEANAISRDVGKKLDEEATLLDEQNLKLDVANKLANNTLQVLEAIARKPAPTLA